MIDNQDNDFRDYLASLPSVEALWWYIENVDETTEYRNDYFFALRERVRDETWEGRQ